MVPYKIPISEVPSTDELAFECEVVTDMWLERCLDARTLVPPEAHVASTPFQRIPIPGKSFSRQTKQLGTDLYRIRGNEDLLNRICAH